MFYSYTLACRKNYSLVEFYDKDFTSDSSTAVGQLFTEIRKRGFEPTRSALIQKMIGKYTGPDGGSPQNPLQNIRRGMPLEAAGIVITLNRKPE
jgi:hypothetical protein